MKECPSCGTMVPASATRCKECFHDFTAVPVVRTNGGPILLLVAAAAMAIIGAGMLWYVTGKPLEERILVDEETHSVIWTRKYRSGIETERLAWSDVAKLEYAILASGRFEIAAIGRKGERYIIQEAGSSLKSEANHYAQMMEKPLDIVDSTRGFGDPE